jgi:hypothetical protein
MSFENAQFMKARPFLFHLTYRNNLDEIRRSRTLFCAASLMQTAGDTSYLRRKRSSSIQLQIKTTTIHLRDQQPLHAGNIRLKGGWSYDDLIQSLNERVFFWPGTTNGPISYGVRHFRRYADESPVLLRVATKELFEKNSDITAQYCKYNSGSPRCTQGKGSSRGPETFMLSTKARYTPCNVVEVTFEKRVILPSQVQLADTLNGPWADL